MIDIVFSRCPNFFFVSAYQTPASSESPPKRQKLADDVNSKVLEHTTSSSANSTSCPQMNETSIKQDVETSFNNIRANKDWNDSDYEDSDDDMTSLSREEQDSAVERLLGYDPKVMPKGMIH